jgi:hypothetical protein
MAGCAYPLLAAEQQRTTSRAPVAARLSLSAAPAGPTTPERQEHIVENALAIANLVGDTAAMTAAVISLIDTVLRHKNTRNSNR